MTWQNTSVLHGPGRKAVAPAEHSPVGWQLYRWSEGRASPTLSPTREARALTLTGGDVCIPGVQVLGGLRLALGGRHPDARRRAMKLGLRAVSVDHDVGVDRNHPRSITS